MKYQKAYDNINTILEMVKIEKIVPINDCKDEAVQIQNLYDKYMDEFIKCNPRYKKYRHKPEMIAEMGTIYLLNFIKENKIIIKL